MLLAIKALTCPFLFLLLLLPLLLGDVALHDEVVVGLDLLVAAGGAEEGGWPRGRRVAVQGGQQGGVPGGDELTFIPLNFETR